MNYCKLKTFLFYFLIIFFPTQLALHFWPQSILLNGYRLDYLSIAIYFTDLILLTLFLLDLFFKKLSLKIFQNKIFLILFLFEIFQLFFLTYKLQQTYFLLKLFLIFYVFFISRPKINKKTISLLFSFQTIFLALLSLAQIFNQGSIQSIFYFLGERRFYLNTPNIATQQILGQKVLRPYATFSHPNALAGFILLVSVYFFYNLKSQSQKTKILKAITLTFSVLIVALSASQAVWAATILFIVLIAFKDSLNKFKKHVLTNTSFFSLVLPFLLLFLTKTTFRQDIIMRNQIFLKLKNLSFSQTITGLGFFDFFKIGQNGAIFQKNLQPIHNLFWQLISSQGLVFIVLVFLLLFQKLKKVKVSYQRTILLVLIIFLGAFDHYFLTSQQNLLLLAFLCSDCFNSKKI